MDHVELAADITARARGKGADECDCLIEVGRELKVKVRSGEVESIERASFRGLGIRLFKGRSLGFGYTTDFAGSSIDDLIDRCFDFASTSTPDPQSGVPPFEPVTSPDLEISDPSIDEIPLAEKIDLALACEQAAYDYDKRIKHTYGTSYSDLGGRVILARMDSTPMSYDETHFDLTCVPVAEQNGEKRMGIWLSAERFLSDLQPARSVGSLAAERAISMLGARSVPTQKAPVVFDSRMGCDIVASIFDGLDGERISRGMSFLKDKLGVKVGSGKVSVVDDGRMPRRLGSRPFDAEGIPTGRSLAIDKGKVKSYFYDFRTARKAGVEPTGNARRGFASIPSVGANNFYLIPGKSSKESVIGGIANGVLITNLLGFGVNITTGDFSRGAEGLWIKDGKISHPVDGITIAGNLLEMMADVEAVASDLHFFGLFGSPTFAVKKMTIAGQ
jgi:PmbA protein